VASAALLWVIFRRIEFAAFLESVRRTRPLWCLLAFAVYGLALAVGAWRWHVALRATERVVHFLATWRLALAGHFFFTALFGVVGGDLAKSAVYARWFRFPLAEVLAAAPLDRALSLAAALGLGLATLTMALFSGGFGAIRHLNVRGPEGWLFLCICVVALGLAIIALWRPKGEGSVVQTLRAIRRGAACIAASPRSGAWGLLAAVIAQTALSAVFAFNLRAVSATSIPWCQLAWTFPAITTLSCLPFTVAGAGVREAAAITLLGCYGIPPGECVAAAMLTMSMKLAWAGIGASVCWHEQRRQQRTEGRPVPCTVSVVIPVLNEAEALPETVRHAQANREICEVIVVDGGSRDATRDLAAQLGCRVLNSPPGRGGQLRLGAAQATGDVVLLLHADTWLPPNAAHAVLTCLRDGSVVAGGFWKVFRDGTWLMKGSRLRCALRLLIGNRVLGDQAMFIRREVLEQIGGVPDMALMEEFELCRRLRAAGRLTLAPATIATSARRFAKLGVVRTYLRMGWVTLRYWLGATPRKLQRLYEKK
jgi:rSAM/selenodomain-associated transferase 2